MMRTFDLCVFILVAVKSAWPQAKPLPSWKEGAARSAIVQFVSDVTKGNSPHYVPVAERIAVFDNDGTLWTEQPVYTQSLLFWTESSS